MLAAPGLTRRIAAGESGDLLIAPDNVVDAAAKLGKIVASTRTPAVAKIGIGVAARRGGSRNPDGRRPQASATRRRPRGVQPGSSGLYIDKMFEQMGIAEQLKAKTVRYANAAQVVNQVMDGQGNEIGFAPMPEVLSSDPKSCNRWERYRRVCRTRRAWISRWTPSHRDG